MKYKLTKAIREVPIADKTYTEYVEAIADKLIAEDYRKIYDDHERQCTCYALGCQMAEGLKRDVAMEFIEAVDSMMECITAMIGCSLTYYGKYAELKKKYTEEGK